MVPPEPVPKALLQTKEDNEENQLQKQGRPALEVLKTPTTQNTAVNGTTGQPPKLGLH